MTTTEMKQWIKRELPVIFREDTEIHQFILELTREQFADKRETESRFDRTLDELRRDREGSGGRNRTANGRNRTANGMDRTANGRNRTANGRNRTANGRKIRKPSNRFWTGWRRLPTNIKATSAPSGRAGASRPKNPSAAP
jgi:hypothetical protein